MSWSSRFLVLGCVIGGLQVAASLALLVRTPIEGAGRDETLLSVSGR